MSDENLKPRTPTSAGNYCCPDTAAAAACGNGSNATACEAQGCSDPFHWCGSCDSTGIAYDGPGGEGCLENCGGTVAQKTSFGTPICCNGEAYDGAWCPGSQSDPHVVPFHGDPYDL